MASTDQHSGLLAGVERALRPAPDARYGTLLPFAREDGDLRLALPQFARDSAQGIVDLLRGAGGELPVGQNIGPDATTALLDVIGGGPLGRGARAGRRAVTNPGPGSSSRPAPEPAAPRAVDPTRELQLFESVPREPGMKPVGKFRETTLSLDERPQDGGPPLFRYEGPSGGRTESDRPVQNALTERDTPAAPGFTEGETRAQAGLVQGAGDRGKVLRELLQQDPEARRMPAAALERFALQIESDVLKPETPGFGGMTLEELGTVAGRVFGRSGVSRAISLNEDYAGMVRSKPPDARDALGEYRAPRELSLLLRQGFEPNELRDVLAHELSHGLLAIRDKGSTDAALARIAGKADADIEDMTPELVLNSMVNARPQTWEAAVGGRDAREGFQLLTELVRRDPGIAQRWVERARGGNTEKLRSTFDRPELAAYLLRRSELTADGLSQLMTKPGEGHATMPKWSDFLRRAIKTDPATRGKIAPALVPAFVAAERLRDDQMNKQLRGQGRAPRRTAR